MLCITRNMSKKTLEFTLNEEYEVIMLNGQKVKSIISFENNTMTQLQNSDPPLIIVSNFFNHEMVAITTYKDVVCTSWYKAVG